MSNEALSNLLHEERTFPPSEDFAAAAVAKADLYDRAGTDRLGFWAEQADRLQWETRWDDVLDWRPPFAKWFVGGTLNVARTTAWTGTWTPATATRWRCTGRASPATPAP